MRARQARLGDQPLHGYYTAIVVQDGGQTTDPETTMAGIHPSTLEARSSARWRSHTAAIVCVLGGVGWVQIGQLAWRDLIIIEIDDAVA